jgi:hypothetical protein
MRIILGPRPPGRPQSGADSELPPTDMGTVPVQQGDKATKLSKLFTRAPVVVRTRPQCGHVLSGHAPRLRSGGGRAPGRDLRAERRTHAGVHAGAGADGPLLLVRAHRLALDRVEPFGGRGAGADGPADPVLRSLARDRPPRGGDSRGVARIPARSPRGRHDPGRHRHGRQPPRGGPRGRTAWWAGWS